MNTCAFCRPIRSTVLLFLSAIVLITAATSHATLSCEDALDPAPIPISNSSIRSRSRQALTALKESGSPEQQEARQLLLLDSWRGDLVRYSPDRTWSLAGKINAQIDALFAMASIANSGTVQFRAISLAIETAKTMGGFSLGQLGALLTLAKRPLLDPMALSLLFEVTSDRLLAGHPETTHARRYLISEALRLDIYSPPIDYMVQKNRWQRFWTPANETLSERAQRPTSSETRMRLVQHPYDTARRDRPFRASDDRTISSAHSENRVSFGPRQVVGLVTNYGQWLTPKEFETVLRLMSLVGVRPSRPAFEEIHRAITHHPENLSRLEPILAREMLNHGVQPQFSPR